MRITDQTYFQSYQRSVNVNIEQLFFSDSSRQVGIQLDFRTKTSAVFSANIEGNSIDITAYMNSELSEGAFKPRKEFEEISDLVKAYEFAIENELNEANFLEAHRLLAQTILIKDKRGRYRTDRMRVYDNSGLVYLAVEPEKVQTEMKTFFMDLSGLLTQKLSVAEVLYHASLIHLKIAQIHPFWDGNGRAARLIEKWFLTQQLGPMAWKVESEHNYKDNLEAYYRNINLGMDYYSLNDEKCIPFLQVLVNTLKFN